MQAFNPLNMQEKLCNAIHRIRIAQQNQEADSTQQAQSVPSPPS
jgi:hypothetical protein